MTEASEALERLDRALNQAGTVISRVRPGQEHLPTPCTDWDVRELVNHVVADVRQFSAGVGGEAADKPEGDLIDDDWEGAYRRAAADLMSAWRQDGVLERPVKTPMGEVPATWRIGNQVADLVVHAWDIAVATGQSTELDPELGEASLAWGRENLKPEFRGEGKQFAEEVPVEGDAPLHDRLAAFFGRRRPAAA
jgi:uncharacterized protein (TIGR03086 family)